MTRRRITDTAHVIIDGEWVMVHRLDDGSWVTGIPLYINPTTAEIKAKLTEKIRGKRGEIEKLVHVYDAVLEDDA